MHKVAFFLGALEGNDVEWLLQVGNKMELPTDAVLIHEGKNIKALYILLDGELMVTAGEGANLRTIAKLGVGEIVGELSFIDHRPPSATVKAAGDIQVLAIPRDALDQKIAEDPGFSSRFYKAVGVLLASRLRKTVSSLSYLKKSFGGEDPNEFDPNTVASISLAEDWFDFILKKLGNN